MSVRPPAPDAEGYCTPEELTDFFEKIEVFLDRGEVLTVDGDVVDAGSVPDADVVEKGPTDPTRSNVEKRILAASNWIDNYTGHAWRPRQVEKEYISLGGNYYWMAGTPMKLQKRDIVTPLDPSEGDKLEIFTGNEWEDWVDDSAIDEGRNGDYWIEDSTGMLYLYRRRLWFRRHKEIRVTYRYGKERVPQTIRDVCARKAAIHYLEAQQYRMTTPGNEEGPDALAVAENWREQCEKELEEYQELRTLGNQ